MNEQTGLFPRARSWQDIPQEVRPRAMSKSGRRRYVFSITKVVLGSLFILGFVVGLYQLISTIENDPRKIALASEVGPIRPAPLFKTDGVLTAEWAMCTLGLPKNVSLMEIDLASLQSKLLASGQVRIAMLAKRFPDTLVITLNERTPVVRLMVRERAGVERLCFAARDGVIFQADCYEKELVESLPWLDLPKLVRSNGRFAPIVGMDKVSDLLTKAKYETKDLYPSFQVISLSKLHSDGEIEIRSPECEALIFNANEDYLHQLACLDYILNVMKPTPENPLTRMDLSLGTGVPVSFRNPLPGGPALRSMPLNSGLSTQPPRRAELPLFSNSKRKPTQREL